MASPASRLLPFVCVLALPGIAFAQLSVTQPDQFTGVPAMPAVNANGMAIAQNNAAIDQARLHRDAVAPPSTGVNADGMALPQPESTTPEDDSFGAQMILKTQERVRSFVVTGGASVAYTSNVALTRRDERHDIFAVVDAGIGWSRRLTSELETSIGAHISIFRYNRTPDLDFENLGFSAGLAWTPRAMGGISFFGRYDLTELLDRSGDEILREHSITLGLQKTVALGRSHGFALGLLGTAALSEPDAAQRQQIGAFISYHLRLTRNLETAVLFRPAVHFYSDSDRTDFNQIISLTLRYRFTPWAEFVASLSHGFNRSDRSVFDYDVLTSGAAVALSLRF